MHLLSENREWEGVKLPRMINMVGDILFFMSPHVTELKKLKRKKYHMDTNITLDNQVLKSTALPTYK